MAVKGQEFAAYDGRAMQGMGLGYATSNRGACHLRASPYASDFATMEVEEKPKVVKDSQDFIAAIDSSGLCLFPKNTGMELDSYVSMLNAACNTNFTEESFCEMGERIWNLERQFNYRAGLTIADDTLPKRILEEPAPSGAAKGNVNRLGEMLPEYYNLRGWGEDGAPTPDTLKRLGL